MSSELVIEAKFFCEICNKHYREYKTTDQLKGKGNRIARERGHKIFPNLGILMVPHTSCVREKIGGMMLNGEHEKVEYIAKMAGMTLENYLHGLNL